MGIQMRIDSPRYRARALYDGHRHPILSQWFKGWHARPGKETVSSPLLAQPARSPSRTGHASFQPHDPADKHLNELGTTTSQTRPQEPLTVSTTSIELVDPPINGTPPVSLADMARLVSVSERAPHPGMAHVLQPVKVGSLTTGGAGCASGADRTTSTRSYRKNGKPATLHVAPTKYVPGAVDAGMVS
jgi:hypothetical protein